MSFSFEQFQKRRRLRLNHMRPLYMRVVPVAAVPVCGSFTVVLWSQRWIPWVALGCFVTALGAIGWARREALRFWSTGRPQKVASLGELQALQASLEEDEVFAFYVADFESICEHLAVDVSCARDALQIRRGRSKVNYSMLGSISIAVLSAGLAWMHDASWRVRTQALEGVVLGLIVLWMIIRLPWNEVFDSITTQNERYLDLLCRVKRRVDHVALDRRRGGSSVLADGRIEALLLNVQASKSGVGNHGGVSPE